MISKSTPNHDTQPQQVDPFTSLKKGALAALAAVPATTLAHPADMVKIRAQTKGMRSPEAFHSLKQLHGINWVTKGLTANIQQKMTTRAPMFAIQHFYGQIFETHLGVSGTGGQACASFLSGATTGSLAAFPEYMKVQHAITRQSVSSLRVGRVLMANPAIFFNLAKAPALRNGIYDSAFFTSSGHLRNEYNLSVPASFAAGALIAVVADYPIDRATKQTLQTPPGTLPKALLELVKSPFHSGLSSGASITYRGILARGIEVSIAYGITGTIMSFA